MRRGIKNEDVARVAMRQDKGRVRRSPDGTTRLEDERVGIRNMEMHNTNLFNQNEDAGGGRIDEATGKAYNNDRDSLRELDRLSLRTAETVEGMGLEKEREPDAAELWLRQNDPSHPLYEGKAKQRRVS